MDVARVVASVWVHMFVVTRVTFCGVILVLMYVVHGTYRGTCHTFL